MTEITKPQSKWIATETRKPPAGVMLVGEFDWGSGLFIFVDGKYYDDYGRLISRLDGVSRPPKCWLDQEVPMTTTIKKFLRMS